MTQDKPLPAFEGTIHLVFSTHWDREWYMPFQKYRAKLVRILDEILAEMEVGRLPFYQMDGQFIPVEDYLEIRPEKEKLLRDLIGAGRFRVGPWYDLPDEFLVSGESLVRNFLMGMRRSAAFGQTSRPGWLCDIFGHNSQTPQVLAQLGIDNVVLWRGADLALGTPFWWRAADGTRLVTHRFPANGYCDFGINIRRAFIRDDNPTPEQMVDRALDYLRQQQAATAARTLLWFDGSDHIDYDPHMIEFAAQFNARMGREVVKVSTLDHYFAELDAATNGEKWPEFSGEMREACAMESEGWLIPGVASSRIPLKQANHACETLLTLWAEPWCAIAAQQAGVEYPERALELAWEYLIKNHPHDSICGCSIDETHNAMPYRFDQTRQIGEVHLSSAFETIAALHARAVQQDEEISLHLFAPAGGAAQSSPEVCVKLPAGWPQFDEFFGYEKKPSLRVYTMDGAEVPYQLLEVKPVTTHLRVARNKFPLQEPRQEARFALDTTIAPATSQHFMVRRAEGPTRIAQTGAIGVGRDRLRNEFLEVQAASDGTLTLTDRVGGRVYPGLLAMEDTADIGDGWFHGIALQDRGVLSTGGVVTAGLLENGPLLARLQMRVEWPVPRDFDFHINRRSTELSPLVVEHLVTLRKGSRHVEIATTVHNTVRDHRLRLFCPTGYGCENFWADTPFDAVERPVKLREDNHLLRELQVEMTPQQNWVAARDGAHGLALLAPGQYESAVLDQPDRPLCLTLLRGFRKAVFTDGNDGGQIIGSHTIRLGLMPFAATDAEPVPATALFQAAQAIAAPVRSVYLDAQDFRDRPEQIAPPAGPLPEVPRVEGDVVLSAWQQAAPGQWMVRVYNPSSQPQVLRLRGGANWATCDFHGERANAISGAQTTIAPRQILTLQVATD